MRFARVVALLTLAAVMSATALAAEPDPRIAALIAAYPDVIKAQEGNDLVLADGTKFVIDDGRGKKPFETLLDEPDIDDQFYVPYQLGNKGFPPGVDEDPGRVRFEPLFKKMYGDCEKGEVKAKLVTVKWLPKHKGGSVEVNSANGLAKALEAVSAELDEMDGKFIRYLKPSAGTYNCRVIAGTKRMSMHAYAAAIDINTKVSDYWRWAKPAKDGTYPYKNQVPIEIVDVFEKHGFIWGGKWYHYDTMHFEYRPELIALGKAAAQ
ncbi:MAG: M15 family metallopeptidase [Hyphomicrobiaceae bacterium]